MWHELNFVSFSRKLTQAICWFVVSHHFYIGSQLTTPVLTVHCAAPLLGPLLDHFGQLRMLAKKLSLYFTLRQALDHSDLVKCSLKILHVLSDKQLWALVDVVGGARDTHKKSSVFY